MVQVHAHNGGHSAPGPMTLGVEMGEVLAVVVPWHHRPALFGFAKIQKSKTFFFSSCGWMDNVPRMFQWYLCSSMVCFLLPRLCYFVFVSIVKAFNFKHVRPFFIFFMCFTIMPGAGKVFRSIQMQIPLTGSPSMDFWLGRSLSLQTARANVAPP